MPNETYQVADCCFPLKTSLTLLHCTLSHLIKIIKSLSFLHYSVDLLDHPPLILITINQLLRTSKRTLLEIINPIQFLKYPFLQFLFLFLQLLHKF